MKRLTSLGLILLLCAQMAIAQESNCLITGTILSEQTGQPLPGIVVTVHKVYKARKLLRSVPQKYRSNLSGVISFSLVRGAVALIETQVEGFNVPGGVSVQIPDAASATLETLQRVTMPEQVPVAVPTESGAPVDAGFITKTPNGVLSNEQALSSLGTGLVKNTTGTGVLSIAGAADLPSGIAAPKISGGNVSNAEFDTLDGAASPIQPQLDSLQSQINAKQAALGFTPENAANKNLAGGYPGLTASTKLNLAHGQEVWGLSDLSDVTAKKGNSTIVQMQTGATSANDCAKFDSAGNLVSAGGPCGGGSGAPYADTTSIVKGSSDATKELRFEVDGFTTGTVRVATFPDANINVARIDAGQTFTGVQTFSSRPTVNGLNNSSNFFGFFLESNADPNFAIQYSGATVHSGMQIGWNSTSTFSGSTDAGLARVAPAIIKATNGSSGLGALQVLDEAYGAGWNGSNEVATKNAIFDKIETLGGGGSPSYDIGGGINGLPDPNEYLMIFPAVRSTTLPASLTGAQGYAITPSTASVTFTIYRRASGTTTDSQLGTMVFSAGSRTATFTVTDAGQLALSAGDILLVKAPGTQDATLANLGFVFKIN